MNNLKSVKIIIILFLTFIYLILNWLWDISNNCFIESVHGCATNGIPIFDIDNSIAAMHIFWYFQIIIFFIMVSIVMIKVSNEK